MWRDMIEEVYFTYTQPEKVGGLVRISILCVVHTIILSTATLLYTCVTSICISSVMNSISMHFYIRLE